MPNYKIFCHVPEAHHKIGGGGGGWSGTSSVTAEFGGRWQKRCVCSQIHRLTEWQGLRVCLQTQFWQSFEDGAGKKCWKCGWVADRTRTSTLLFSFFGGFFNPVSVCLFIIINLNTFSIALMFFLCALLGFVVVVVVFWHVFFLLMLS